MYRNSLRRARTKFVVSVLPPEALQEVWREEPPVVSPVVLQEE